ncbi:hypothetical protein, partial [Acetonema longum]
ASGIAPTAVFNLDLSAADSSFDVIIGNVVYHLENASTTALSLSLSSTGGSILVDIKRSTQWDSASEGSSLDGVTLTASSMMIDGTIFSDSNEMHRTWIRQQDPVTGLWSQSEVDLFVSVSGARTSVWVYPIYEDASFSAP